MDFLIIGSLFSFLYRPSSTFGEVANEKFWTNHRSLLYTLTVTTTTATTNNLGLFFNPELTHQNGWIV